MADLIVVYWKDIPAQVKVRRGRETLRRELSSRFAEAIDMAAMRSGDKDFRLLSCRLAHGRPRGNRL